jgi:hypothetical protein
MFVSTTPPKNDAEGRRVQKDSSGALAMNDHELMTEGDGLSVERSSSLEVLPK